MSKYKVNHQDETSAKPIDSNRVSYGKGYTDGKIAEHNRQVKETRENNSTFIGLLIGVSLTVAVGLIFAVSNILSDNQETQITEPSEKVTEPEQPNREETTIIEKTVEKSQELVPVPVPQDSNSSPSEPKTNVEINIPNPLEGENSNSQPSESESPSNNQPSSSESTQTENSTNESSGSNAQ